MPEAASGCNAITASRPRPGRHPLRGEFGRLVLPTTVKCLKSRGVFGRNTKEERSRRDRDLPDGPGIGGLPACVPANSSRERMRSEMESPPPETRIPPPVRRRRRWRIAVLVVLLACSPACSHRAAVDSAPAGRAPAAQSPGRRDPGARLGGVQTSIRLSGSSRPRSRASCSWTSADRPCWSRTRADVPVEPLADLVRPAEDRDAELPRGRAGRRAVRRRQDQPVRDPGADPPRQARARDHHQDQSRPVDVPRPGIPRAVRGRSGRHPAGHRRRSGTGHLECRCAWAHWTRPRTASDDRPPRP